MIVVADSSPVHYLLLVGHIEILPKLFGGILMPEAVLLELRHAAAPSKVSEWADQLPSWVKVAGVRATNDPELAKLGAGERDAIQLSLEYESILLLVDEAKGRRIAERRGLQVIGTLGLLDAASANGLLSITDAIDRLRATNFHIAPKLLRNLLDRAARRSET